MSKSELGVSLKLGGLMFDMSVPVSNFAEAFDSLRSHNDELRARAEDPELRPYRKIRIVCPNCNAPVFFLTAIDRPDGKVRACRKCRSEFPVGT